MVKIVCYDIPIDNFANKATRPGAIERMEQNLDMWSGLGWRIVSVQSDNSGQFVVFLEK